MNDRPPAPRRAAPWADVAVLGPGPRRRLADAGAARRHPRLAASIGAAPAIREYGLSFLWTQRVGSGPEPLRRPGDDLRHADDVAHRAGDRRAGQLRHRAVPDRALAALAEAPARHRDRAARGGAVDRLRHVGPARVQPDPGALRAAAAAIDLQGRAAARRAVLRAAGRHRPALGRASSWRSWSSRSSPR